MPANTGSEASVASDTVARLKAEIEIHRERDAQQTEQIARLESDLTRCRSLLTSAGRRLMRLRSRYTVVLSPDHRIDNADRLYELVARDARAIGQELLGANGPIEVRVRGLHPRSSVGGNERGLPSTSR